MSTLTRWEPLHELMTLREAMDRLFDDAFTRPIGIGASAGGAVFLPVLDLYESNDAVIVKAALPGLKAEDVEISVTVNALTLRGEFKQEAEHKDTTYHIREQRFGLFERSVPLPANVRIEGAKADFENGMLVITLPKAEVVKPKMINIKAK